MTHDILELMDARGLYNNRNNGKYREKHNQKKRETVTAKENWMRESCQEIEKLLKKYDD